MLDLVTTADPISEKDIQNFESLHKIRLPQSYANFLLRQNGGNVYDSDDFYSYRIDLILVTDFAPNGHRMTEHIEEFDSLDELSPGYFHDLEFEHYDNEEEQQLLEERAKSILEIASGIEGFIYLGIAESNFGYVYFHYKGYIDIKNNPYLIANSFDDFIQKLYKVEE